MKVEEKQALTGLCRIEIKRWKAASESNPNMRYMVELMEVALSALNAHPVKLPKSERLDGNGYGYYFDMDDVFVALESAGVKFEVQE